MHKRQFRLCVFDKQVKVTKVNSKRLALISLNDFFFQNKGKIIGYLFVNLE